MGWGCPYTRTSKNRRFLLIRAYAECLLCRLAFALLYTLPALQACFRPIIHATCSVDLLSPDYTRYLLCRLAFRVIPSAQAKQEPAQLFATNLNTTKKIP